MRDRTETCDSDRDDARRDGSDSTAATATGGDAGTMDASLAARMTRSEAEGANLNDEEPLAVPGMPAIRAEPVGHGRPMEAGGAGPKQERGLGLEEGSERTPRTGGRVDAAGATKGIREGDEGATAAGMGTTSVGGAQGTAPGSGVADQPWGRAPGPAGRAGFLEDEGRYGAETSGGELFDDEGGHIRSAADVAGAVDGDGEGA